MVSYRDTAAVRQTAQQNVQQILIVATDFSEFSERAFCDFLYVCTDVPVCLTKTDVIIRIRITHYLFY